jgi:hypothetical protein
MWRSPLLSHRISTRIVPYLLLNWRPQLTLKPCSHKTLILSLLKYNTLALHLALNSSGGNVSGSYQPFSLLLHFCNPVNSHTSPTEWLAPVETKIWLKTVIKILEFFWWASSLAWFLSRDPKKFNFPFKFTGDTHKLKVHFPANTRDPNLDSLFTLLMPVTQLLELA